MRALLVALALACLALVPAAKAGHVDYVKLKEPVVKIIAGSKVGSGVMYSCTKNKNGNREVRIITARHVLEQNIEKTSDSRLPKTIWVTWFAYTNATARPVASEVKASGFVMSPKYDLAEVIVTWAGPCPRLSKLSNAPASMGEHVTAVGFPLNVNEAHATHGNVDIIYYEIQNDTETYFMASTLVESGSSGGGLFNDQYELVGITSAMYGVSHMSLFSRLESIKEFVDSERVVSPLGN